MASWTSEIVKFTPYIPESPLDPMLSVGLTKQQQFMEGVQKVQSYVDTLNGMDISKKEIKDYVQVKLNSFHQNINNVSGDFSDQRLISQIGGAVGKIASDPIVQNGILATNSIRNGYAQIEQARKEGKSNPNNEIYFSDAVDRWMNDGRADTQLSASYTPYFDIVKRVREVYKDMSEGQDLPASFSLSNLSVDENGRPIFNLNSASEMVLMEGISAKRVQDAVDLVMQDGNAKQQLLIDGYARFRGLSPNDIFDNIVTSTQTQLQQINDLIAAGQAKLGGSTAGDKAQLAENIKLLEAQAKGIAANSQRLVDGLAVNPEAVKAQIVQQELTSNLIGAFSHQKMVESPLWNQNIELERLNLSKQQFIFEQFDKNRTYELNKSKAEKEKEGTQPSNYVANLPTPNTAGQVGQATMVSAKESALEKANDASLVTLYEYVKTLPGTVQPFIKDPSTGKWVPNADAYGGGPEGVKKAWAERIRLQQSLKTQRSKGTISPDIAEAVDTEEKAWDDYNVISNREIEIEKKFKPQMDKIKEAVGIRKDGTNYPASWFDAYAVDKGLKGAEAAEKRLISKYGPGWKSALGLQFPTSNLAGPTNSSSSFNFGEYSILSNKLANNKDVIPIAQAVEEEFKKSQSAFQNKATVFDVSKEQLRNDVETAFTAALAEQNLAREQSDAADLRSWLGDKDLKGGNQYFAWQESAPGGKKSWWVGVQRTDSDGDVQFKKVELTQEAFLQNQKLQQALPNMQFNEKFGTRLSARGGRDTYNTDKDITINNGNVSSFYLKTRPGTVIYNDSKGNQTTTTPVVQYHLMHSERSPGNYTIKLYVTDSKTGEQILPGVSYPAGDMMPDGSPTALSREQVMANLELLKNPVYLQGFIEKIKNR